MRPAREREIRAACERTGFDRTDPGDSPGEMMRDLLAEVDRLRSSTGGLLLVHRHEIARAVGLPEDAPGHEVVAAVRELRARALYAEGELSAAFGLPPTVGHGFFAGACFGWLLPLVVAVSVVLWAQSARGER